MAFAIGSFFAGVAGALYAHNFYIIQPVNFGFLKSIDILIYVVLGGLGSLSGAVVATILLTIVSTFLQGYPETRMIIYSLVLNHRYALSSKRFNGYDGNYGLLQVVERFERRQPTWQVNRCLK